MDPYSSVSNSFVDARQDQGLDCPICIEPFNNPRRITVCKHTFCLECITEVAAHAIPKNIIPTCPICRKHFTINDLRENGKINEESKPEELEPSPIFAKAAQIHAKLDNLVSIWPLHCDCEPETAHDHHTRFQEILNEVVNSFINDKLPLEECKQIAKTLKEFRKDVESATDIPPNRREEDYGDVKKERRGLSQNLWEHLNYVLNLLEPDLPKEVLEHVSFSRKCLKFSSSEEARQYASKVVQKANEEKPEQCHYLLRPSTRGRGNDTTQKFTLSYIDPDGKTSAWRLGRNPEGWVIYSVTENNDEKISHVLGTLDEAIKRALSHLKKEICPINSEFFQKLDKTLA